MSWGRRRKSLEQLQQEAAEQKAKEKAKAEKLQKQQEALRSEYFPVDGKLDDDHSLKAYLKAETDEKAVATTLDTFDLADYIAKGGDIHVVHPKFKNSLLHYYCRIPNPEKIQMLADAGFNLEQENELGFTALAWMLLIPDFIEGRNSHYYDANRIVVVFTLMAFGKTGVSFAPAYKLPLQDRVIPVIRELEKSAKEEFIQNQMASQTVEAPKKDRF